MERKAAVVLEKSIFGELFSVVLNLQTENKHTIN